MWSISLAGAGMTPRRFRDNLPPRVSSVDDRRRHPRYEVRGLSGVLDGFRLFDALKLSLGGVMIRVPAELALEQRVRIELPLGDETFRATARVVFIGPDLDGEVASGQRFRVGLQFAPPAAADQELLERYIGALVAAGAPS